MKKNQFTKLMFLKCLTDKIISSGAKIEMPLNSRAICAKIMIPLLKTGYRTKSLIIYIIKASITNRNTLYPSLVIFLLPHPLFRVSFSRIFPSPELVVVVVVVFVVGSTWAEAPFL